MTEGLRTGADGRARCAWCGDDPLYPAYHDREWGRPTQRRPLPVREALPRRLPVRPVLDHHPPQARELPPRLRELRRRGPVPLRPRRRRPACWPTPASSATAARSNRSSTTPAAPSSCARKPARSHAFVQRFAPDPRPERLDWATLRTIPKTPESTALSKELRKRGWSFVGPTTVYAFMQAVGLVDDHVAGCWVG